MDPKNEGIEEALSKILMVEEIIDSDFPEIQEASRWLTESYKSLEVIFGNVPGTVSDDYFSIETFMAGAGAGDMHDDTWCVNIKPHLSKYREGVEGLRE